MGSEVNGAPDKLFVQHRLAVMLGSALVWTAAHLYAPFVHGGPVICPVHGLVGMPCPTCGLTRAFCALVQGDFLGALQWNALVVPLAILFLAGPVIAGLEIFSGKAYRFYHSFLYSSRIAERFAAVVIVYHVARCAVWYASGTLTHDFVETSWTYRLWQAVLSGK